MMKLDKIIQTNCQYTDDTTMVDNGDTNGF